MPSQSAVKMEPAATSAAEPLELEKAREPASHVPGLRKDYFSHLALKRKYPTPSGKSFTIQSPQLINANNVPLFLKS